VAGLDKGTDFDPHSFDVEQAKADRALSLAGAAR
jgi:hypothetical protein